MGGMKLFFELLAAFAFGGLCIGYPIFFLYRRAQAALIRICNEAAARKGNVSAWTIDNALRSIGYGRADRSKTVELPKVVTPDEII